MKKVVVINGPNLNLLGQRETSMYGKETLADIKSRLTKTASKHGWKVEFFQSNHEGEIVEFLHALRPQKGKSAKSSVPEGIIINAGAYTHTSVAIRDALSTLAPLPFIELHISNVFKRETFRHHSYLSDIATGVVIGLGTRGYDLALSHFIETDR